MEEKELDLAILKELTTNKKHAIDFIHEASDKIFSPEYWFFAKQVIEYLKLFKDIPTKRILLERLNKGKNDPQFINVDTTWNKVELLEVDSKEFKHNLEALKNRYAINSLHELQEKLTKYQSSTDIKKAVNDIQGTNQVIKSLYTTKKFDQKTLKESLPDFRSKYTAKKDNPDFGRGIYTGYHWFDFITNGIRPAEMMLIGAESGGGKSLMLMNMAVQMWMQQNTIEKTSNFTRGYNVLFFSLEMPHEDCLERTLARLAMVPQKGLRDSTLVKEDLTKMAQAAKFIENYPYEFDIVDIPRGATVEGLELLFNEAKTKYNPDIVVVDYLGLMDYESSAEIDDWLKLGKISEKLHEFGRVHNVVMLSAVQLTDIKRSNKGPDMQIGMHRVGRSSLIFHNCNFGLQIEKRQNEEVYPDMLIHMIKSRRTELAKGRMNKHFACCALLDSIDTVQENVEDISKKMIEISK